MSHILRATKETRMLLTHSLLHLLKAASFHLYIWTSKAPKQINPEDGNCSVYINVEETQST
jgi:hypothetical protein